MPNMIEVFREITLRVAAVGSLASAADEAISRVSGRSDALDDAINLISVLGEEVERTKTALDTLEKKIWQLDFEE